MTCKESILAQLTDLPPSWAEQIANVVCDTIKVDVTCQKVKDCETVTELSVFSVTGTNVCIQYKDEDGATFKRCFDMQNVINNSLYDVDPKCLTSMVIWQGMSFKAQWQMIVDKVCTDCTPVYPTSTTTTTTHLITSTTTTTQVPTTTSTTSTSTITTLPFFSCSTWQLTGGTTGTNWSYKDCTGISQLLSVLPSDTVTVCADDNFGMNKFSGDGTKTNLGSC